METLFGNSDAFSCSANEVINFKLIRSQEDIANDAIAFHPEMTHQIFGSNEKIFGYEGIKVNVYYMAGCLSAYIDISYSKLISSADNMAPDNVERIIARKLPQDYFTNIDAFCNELEKDYKFKPFGILKHSYTVKDSDANDRYFEIYMVDCEDTKLADFLLYHKRMQSFLLYYVDGASFIEDDDERWVFYVTYERDYRPSINAYSYVFVGYMTVYKFYAYPEHTRPRVSQVVILPPFQRQGHGSELLRTFYNDAVIMPKVVDITVEDPSENYQRMRDIVDCRNCLRLPVFSSSALTGESPVLTKAMKEEVRNKLKLNYRQIRRVYEILRLRAIDRHNEEQWTYYTNQVHGRIEALFVKPRSMYTSSSSQSTSAKASLADLDHRRKQIQEECSRVVEEYQIVVDKLDKFCV